MLRFFLFRYVCVCVFVLDINQGEKSRILMYIFLFGFRVWFCWVLSLESDCFIFFFCVLDVRKRKFRFWCILYIWIVVFGLIWNCSLSKKNSGFWSWMYLFQFFLYSFFWRYVLYIFFGYRERYFVLRNNC